MRARPATGPKVLIQHSGDASILVQNAATTNQHNKVGKTNLANEKVNYDMYFFLPFFSQFSTLSIQNNSLRM